MTTTRALVEEGAARLRDALVDTPRLDADLLLAHAIGVDRTAVIAHGDAPVGPGAEGAFRAFVDRRAAGEPVAYIRGLREFHGIALTVDARALIPRPETEALVDRGLTEVMGRLGAGPGGVVRVADVGTGSGAVAIALAVALRTRRVPADAASIDAIDVSSEALDLARENAVAHGVVDRLTFEVVDLLPERRDGLAWDVVLANLPYVRSGDLAGLAAETTYEPTLALDGGPDGLGVIDRLLQRLPAALAADGVAMLEIGAEHGGPIVEHVASRLPGWSCVVHPDLAGLPRIAVVRRGGR